MWVIDDQEDLNHHAKQLILNKIALAKRTILGVNPNND
jgi:hypothetical protein